MHFEALKQNYSASCVFLLFVCLPLKLPRAHFFEGSPVFKEARLTAPSYLGHCQVGFLKTQLGARPCSKGSKTRVYTLIHVLMVSMLSFYMKIINQANFFPTGPSRPQLAGLMRRDRESVAPRAFSFLCLCMASSAKAAQSTVGETFGLTLPSASNTCLRPSVTEGRCQLPPPQQGSTGALQK